MINKERLNSSKQINILYDNIIRKKGKDFLIKQIKDSFKKNEIDIISNCFINFKKSIKCYPQDIKNIGKHELSLCNTFNLNKNNTPIFEVPDDNEIYNVKIPVIPFSHFFISSNVVLQDGYQLYSIDGFFCGEFDNDIIWVMYIWGNLIEDGWGINSFIYNKNTIEKDNKDFMIGDKNNKVFYNNNVLNIEKINVGINKFVHKNAPLKFHHLLKKLIYNVNNKSYNSYKKYENGQLRDKQIIFSNDVKAHIRHFWKDSGRFKIPLMKKEEWEGKGYGTHELVEKDGEWRKDVPFRIIGDKIIKKKEEENKIYSLIKRRIWKSEQKVFLILKELFPNNYIRRHDRKTLNGLELDFNLPELRLGIEYDGEQHFDRKLCEEVFKSDFDALVKRDRDKNKRCRKKNITLIRIKYDEPLTKTHIKKKLINFLN